VLTVQPLMGWYARNPVFPGRFMKRSRSPEENSPDLFGYRLMTEKEVRFSTAC
jgi:hypothetical protein